MSHPRNKPAVVREQSLAKAASLPLARGGRYLVGTRVSAEACGKAILIGEHAVLYGHPAVAVALPDLVLRLSILPSAGDDGPSSWDTAWQVITVDGRRPLTAESRDLLTRCLAMALRDSSADFELEGLNPQPLRIESNFPMGAGLGGSASLCVAAVRLAEQLARGGGEESKPAGDNGSAQPSSFFPGLARAARLDQIFHGTASGIDTATSFCGGLISAQGAGRARRFESLPNLQRFYIALVDSGSRSSTADMVARLAGRRRDQPVFVGDKLARLGALAEASVRDLAGGRLADLGERLNEAQEHLCDLGMSTPDLDRIVREMRELGALGAKLTGSGGGGFALGIFRDYPEWVESFLATKGAVYVSEVPAVSSDECERRSAILRGGSPQSPAERH